MPRCVSFVHSRRHAAAWFRCARRARRGDVFCPTHRDTLDGAVIGALQTSNPLHVSKTKIQRAGFDGASAKIALECALALLTVPPGIPKARRPKSSRKEKRKASAAAVDSSATPLPPQAGADG